LQLLPAGLVITDHRGVDGWKGAIMKSGRERVEPLQFMLTGEELELVDDFRFQKRMPSRTSAVRELLKRGLAAEGFATAAVGAKSSDYGVSGKTPTGRHV
jgi:hypothetical protein